MEEVGSIERLQKDSKNNFEILPTGYKVNIEFNNLIYEVPDRKKGFRSLLKNVNGEFRANELTVLMGTSGSGKTTLINVLAGYRIHETSGTVNVNKRPRNMKFFRRLSRYILQDDHISPHFTVMESMLFAAKLKLDSRSSEKQHIHEINKVLEMMYLTKQANTKVLNLSGGERKRLCIGLELLNIPTVLFLDEPTTGLDEFSAMQCITMLKYLAASGRTIICSIHGPSARMFQMFDNVYVLADGECVYQGSTTNILPYVTHLGLDCPITYNPADFIIEVAAREYGNYHEAMVTAVKNGKIYKWSNAGEDEKTKNGYSSPKTVKGFEMELDNNSFADITTPWLLEYRILYMQMLTQMWRDKAYLKLKVFIKFFTVFCISLVYTEVGTNAKLLIFNYHLVSLAAITFTFLSMCPMLSHIPLEINYLRREYFNQWYRLSSYFMALITSQMPDIFLLGLVSSAMLYFSSDQPLELNRFLLFLIVILLTSMIASSYGLAVSTRLNLLNSLFFGPVIVACWILLSNYSIGHPDLSTFEKTVMYSGHLRHSIEGLMSALYEFNRADAICPPDFIFCEYKKPKFLLKLLGYDNLNYVHSLLYLIGFYVFFSLLGYFNFVCRLDSIKFFERNRYYQTLKRAFV